MKIGDLDMHCGDCKIIDYCGDPYSEICICREQRFKNIEEARFIELAETSKMKSKREIVDDVHKRL